jgi:hypothetical protein
MAWLTAQEFRSLYVTQTASDDGVTVVENCLESAINRISDLVGTVTVTEVANATDNTIRKVSALREAQELLALHKLSFNDTSRRRNGGKVRRERDEDAVTTNEYESYSEMRKYREDLLTDAMRLIEPYLPATEAVEQAFADNYTQSVPIEFVW